MRLYGQVMRRDEEYVGKRAIGIEVQGSRRGRPKRWADCVKDNLRDCQERCTTELHGGLEETIVPHRPDIEVG